jgi:hypothetical protein
MGETELVLSYSPQSHELTRLSVTCEQCATVLTLDVSGEASPGPDAGGDGCPRCPETLGHLEQLVKSYREFHRNLAQASKVSMAFRVAVPIEEQ